MSQLDQVKKQAKRLFNLAQANQTIELPLNSHINIENLSKAKEVLAHISSFKNWHEYEENLKKKDFLFGKVDKAKTNKINQEIYDNRAYYTQDMSFNRITSVEKNTLKVIMGTPHKNIILGRKKQESFFESKEKKWILNQYPVLISGTCGAGKSEILLSMASQYIENKEGVIYFDGKGENIMYAKIFSYAEKYNRIDDLYCLNFMTGSKLPISNNNEPEKLSHTIDPINPMLGNDTYFNVFFGRLGIIIHAILKEIHEQEQLMDTQSLESILMLNNLFSWCKDKKFKTEEIANYMIELGLSLEEENDEDDFNDALLNHATNAKTAFETVKLFKTYQHIFKVNCSINMENIFIDRKILVILLPALEKSPDELIVLGELIAYQIKHTEEKYVQYKTHLQNIIIDEFPYFTDGLKILDCVNTKNNYIFGCMDYYHINDIFNYVINNAKTHIIMKLGGPDIHHKIKLDLINNLSKLPKLKNVTYKNMSFIQNFAIELKELREGQAYILCKNNEVTKEINVLNNEFKYYCELINCEYIPSKFAKKIWLVQHPILKTVKE